MKSIFDTSMNAALILQSGEGTDFSFAGSRPKTDTMRSTGEFPADPFLL
jgi:hypothetical protein